MAVEKNSEPCGCFFCHRPIEANTDHVMWVESNNYVENPTEEGKIRLRLHPRCSVMLGERLIGDGFSADKNVADPDTVKFLVNSRINPRS